MLDDKQLVKQAKQGNHNALAALYDEYQPRVYRYILYRVGDVALAEDLTAEVFVSLVKSMHTYQERGRPFLAWVYTIAGNIVKMQYRRSQPAEWVPLATEMVDDRAGPPEMVHSLLSHEQLIAAMPNLTDDQQQVIYLKFVEGFSNAEVGELLGKTEGSVKSCQHRALAALRRILLEEMGYEPS